MAGRASPSADRLLGAFADALDRPHGRVLRPLLAQRARHPELYAEVYRRVVLPHKEILRGILGAAVERGEAPRGPRRPYRLHRAPPGHRGPHGARHGPAGRGGGGTDAEVLMPLFTARGGGNMPGRDDRSTMGP
ncbi:TetR-like C-terminal domain-containing protein [Actinomadura keratinilytica]